MLVENNTLNNCCRSWAQNFGGQTRDFGWHKRKKNMVRIQPRIGNCYLAHSYMQYCATTAWTLIWPSRMPPYKSIQRPSRYKEQNKEGSNTDRKGVSLLLVAVESAILNNITWQNLVWMHEYKYKNFFFNFTVNRNHRDRVVTYTCRYSSGQFNP